ncbi:MAG: acyl-CoA/acyl-ACP dehydrogenase [Actinomycetota bacterium]|nr:acyl-CoA/acyl-ACP dehydrogenase [Actinomycetota bacterium]
MDFTLSEDQKALQTSVREFLASRFPVERVAEIADGPGWDPAWWPEVTALGWTGVSVPEEAGGLGMGFLEEVVVLEETGRALFPGPYFSTVALALPALASAPDLVADVVGGKRAATLAWGGPGEEHGVSGESNGDGWRLSGAAMFVPDLGGAELVVVAGRAPDGSALWAVERDGPGASWEPLPTVDATRPLGRLTLSDAPGTLLAEDARAAALLEHVRDRALAGLAAEAVGVASRALEMAVGHAKNREQFGRPVGVYQAVSHELADAFVETESARSLTYWAGWAVANGADEAPDAAAAAKAYAAEAAIAACERAIQVHGGIGFTWEHPLHRFYKRALAIGAMFGWPSDQRARVAASLLDES